MFLFYNLKVTRFATYFFQASHMLPPALRASHLSLLSVKEKLSCLTLPTMLSNIISQQISRLCTPRWYINRLYAQRPRMSYYSLRTQDSCPFSIHTLI